MTGSTKRRAAIAASPCVLVALSGGARIEDTAGCRADGDRLGADDARRARAPRDSARRTAHVRTSPRERLSVRAKLLGRRRSRARTFAVVRVSTCGRRLHDPTAHDPIDARRASRTIGRRERARAPRRIVALEDLARLASRARPRRRAQRRARAARARVDVCGRRRGGGAGGAQPSEKTVDLGGGTTATLGSDGSLTITRGAARRSPRRTARCSACSTTR